MYYCILLILNHIDYDVPFRFPSGSPINFCLIKKIFYRLSQATGKRWEPIQSSTQQIDSVLTAYLSINLSIWLMNEYQRLIQTSLEFSGSRL